MSTERLRFAIETGGLPLPDTGRVAWFGAPQDAALPAGPDWQVIHSFRPDHDAWARRGVSVSPDPEGLYQAAIVTLPRARDLAEARIAAACAAAPGGLIVVEGAKTDGIEAIARALRARVPLDGQVSKAHGKCLWFRAGDALADWARPELYRNAEGVMVAPGVFSADAADPASRALAEALPAVLKGHVADLGAGWGWLARAALRCAGVRSLHLVEADRPALTAARENIDDPRAAFHWADALDWEPPVLFDHVIMNPPFHDGRKGDPEIGRSFIAAAARILAPNGTLWLVANRHLPYETALARHFREVEERPGPSRFKILRAARPARHRR